MLKTVKDFSREQIHGIAWRYATSGFELSHRYYEGEYEISQSTFYNLLKKAVIENVVSDEIVEKMAKKSASNSLYSAGRKGQKNSENTIDIFEKEE